VPASLLKNGMLSGRLFPLSIRRRCAGFVLACAALTAVFWTPLCALADYARRSDFHSHALLVPFISGYLLFGQRRNLFARVGSAPRTSAVVATIALASLLLLRTAALRQADPMSADVLGVAVFGFITLVIAAVLFFFGVDTLRAGAFPVFFLYFVVPLPSLAVDWANSALKTGSAEAAYWLLWASGTPLFRDGLVFHLPGLTVEVAEECSGIRSTLVLALTSFLAGHMFLRSPWRKAALVASIVPLALLRNGFRIMTICLLTVHVDAAVFDSPLHRRGGPLFFALSLVPFFLILVLLRRAERNRQAETSTGHESGNTGGR
jgi:exosortase C (VPDSG-CTERM-specific)